MGIAMAYLEMIKIIPVIKQIWSWLCSSKNIKIEVFPNQQFRVRPGTYNWDERDPRELTSNNEATAVSITNYGKEDVLLDQITLNVYVKKGIFRKTKISDVKGEKFKGEFFAKIIPPYGVGTYNCGADFDSSEKDKLIYEVIVEVDGRKIKHVHKVKV